VLFGNGNRNLKSKAGTSKNCGFGHFYIIRDKAGKELTRHVRNGTYQSNQVDSLKAHKPSAISIYHIPIIGT
jgi:hypothetical protein